ncbi:MAG TPA: MarR family transcriptional regulator [Burkholderiaceae bacterium]
MRERYLRSLRLLAQCLQGFERHSNEAVRRFGLTAAQFDIVATLGNTQGMTCKDLGEKTLITKGTLTGVLNRLEERGVLERTRGGDDKRAIYVRLTKQGEALFDQVFPPVIAHDKLLFAGYDDAAYERLEAELGRLKANIDAVAGDSDA